MSQTTQRTSGPRPQGKRPRKEPHSGGEREADERRADGRPRYHGGEWQRADEEGPRGEPTEAPRADDRERVDPGQVPGAHGHGEE